MSQRLRTLGHAPRLAVTRWSEGAPGHLFLSPPSRPRHVATSPRRLPLECRLFPRKYLIFSHFSVNLHPYHGSDVVPPASQTLQPFPSQIDPRIARRVRRATSSLPPIRCEMLTFHSQIPATPNSAPFPCRIPASQSSHLRSHDSWPFACIRDFSFPHSPSRHVAPSLPTSLQFRRKYLIFSHFSAKKKIPSPASPPVLSSKIIDRTPGRAASAKYVETLSRRDCESNSKFHRMSTFPSQVPATTNSDRPKTKRRICASWRTTPHEKNKESLSGSHGCGCVRKKASRPSAQPDRPEDDCIRNPRTSWALRLYSCALSSQPQTKLNPLLTNAAEPL